MIKIPPTRAKTILEMSSAYPAALNKEMGTIIIEVNGTHHRQTPLTICESFSGFLNTLSQR